MIHHADAADNDESIVVLIPPLLQFYIDSILWRLLVLIELKRYPLDLISVLFVRLLLTGVIHFTLSSYYPWFGFVDL